MHAYWIFLFIIYLNGTELILEKECKKEHYV